MWSTSTFITKIRVKLEFASHCHLQLSWDTYNHYQCSCWHWTSLTAIMGHLSMHLFSQRSVTAVLGHLPSFLREPMPLKITKSYPGLLTIIINVAIVTQDHSSCPTSVTLILHAASITQHYLQLCLITYLDNAYSCHYPRSLTIITDAAAVTQNH